MNNKVFKQKNLNNWLNKPFPFYETYKQKIFIPTIFSLLVMFGLIILSPYRNYETLSESLKSILIYGTIVILISLLFSLILPEIFPKLFNSEKWNIKKTLIFLIVSVITIGLSIGFIAFYKEHPKNTNILIFLFRILIRSIILSFLPLIILIFIAERRLFKKNHLSVIEMMNNLKTIDKTNATYHNFVFAKNTKDEIIINENNLFFIKAEANYSLLFFNKNDKTKKRLIRSNLKKIEDVVSISNQFIRCHKSYIVNLNKVSKVTGNAKGYIFYLSDSNIKIPVSRNISKSVIEKIRQNSN